MRACRLCWFISAFYRFFCDSAKVPVSGRLQEETSTESLMKRQCISPSHIPFLLALLLFFSSSLYLSLPLFSFPFPVSLSPIAFCSLLFSSLLFSSSSLLFSLLSSLFSSLFFSLPLPKKRETKTPKCRGSEWGLTHNSKLPLLWPK